MRRMIMPLRYVSSLAAPYALTRRHIAEYELLNEVLRRSSAAYLSARYALVGAVTALLPG
jgi:hypothetical protein